MPSRRGRDRSRPGAEVEFEQAMGALTSHRAWLGSVVEFSTLDCGQRPATSTTTMCSIICSHGPGEHKNRSATVMMSTPNFYRLETSRWDLSNYNDFITAPLDNSDGRLKVPPKPGLGIEMNMDFLRRKRCGLIRREFSRNACSVKLSECGRVLAKLDLHRLVGPQPPRQNARRAIRQGCSTLNT